MNSTVFVVLCCTYFAQLFVWKHTGIVRSFVWNPFRYVHIWKEIYAKKSSWVGVFRLPWQRTLMMIAFVTSTWKRNLVPLAKCLISSNPAGFQVWAFLTSSSILFCQRKDHDGNTKQQRAFGPPHSPITIEGNLQSSVYQALALVT